MIVIARRTQRSEVRCGNPLNLALRLLTINEGSVFPQGIASFLAMTALSKDRFAMFHYARNDGMNEVRPHV
jgi:hypothetical protein